MGRVLLFAFFPFLSIAAAQAQQVQGRVSDVRSESRSLSVELTHASGSWLAGEEIDFVVGPGDLEIGYAGRTVSGRAVAYEGGWLLERIFPVDGAGAKAMTDVNDRLHKETATMSRRSFVQEGDFIPNFALIDQNGDFLQIRQMQGRAFVLNFIFTRCQAPTMCPASTARMASLQKFAADEGMEDLHFVTITFDPEFDSPGILRQYAKGYGIQMDNFHLLTGPQSVTDDLLRQFGILTMEEDGTINHTMATLLVDERGKVAFRKEGSSWTVDEFIEAAKEL